MASRSDYGRAAGMLAGVSAGYRFGGRVRVEAEWFHRESEYDRTSPVASATGDTVDKLGGEIQRAEVRIGSISSHNVFANVYIDFPSASRVTPYVGAGIGMGLVEMDYGDLWTRNPDPAAIVTAAGLPNEAEIRRNLAATTTTSQTELHDRLTGYQVLGGADYAVSELGLRQKAFAELLGVPQSQVSDWEHDRFAVLDISSLIKLAKALHCSVDELLAGVVSTEHDRDRVAWVGGARRRRGLRSTGVWRMSGQAAAHVRERLHPPAVQCGPPRAVGGAIRDRGGARNRVLAYSRSIGPDDHAGDVDVGSMAMEKTA